MKKYLFFFLMVLLGQSTTALAASGAFFHIDESGSTIAASINLCLNGEGPASCQVYSVTHADLSISTTVPNHTYSIAGIKSNTTSYSPTSCTPTSNGYCLFSTSDTTPISISLIFSGETFTVSPSGDGNESITPSTPQTVDAGSTQSFMLTPNSGYVVSNTVGGTCPAGSFSGSTYTTGIITSNCSLSFSATPVMSTITTISSSQNPSTSSSSVTFTADVNAGSGTPTGTLNFRNDGTTISGCGSQTLSSGVATCSSALSTGASITAIYTPNTSTFITSTSSGFTQSVVSSLSGITTVPAAPVDVIAAPGNGQVTVSWLPPSNTGGQAITGYTVEYGITGSPPFTSLGCTTSGALSCTVNSLSNGTSYTFAVTATNPTERGPIAYSSPAIPRAILTVSPANLALSGLGGGEPRTITFTNVSGSPIPISSVSTFSPSLPSGSSYSTTCKAGTMASGATCTVTVTPGSTATSACTAGTTPTASVISLNDASLSANVVVLGYGCIYQGGYVFNIDDTAPLNGSIEGTVADESDLVSSPLVWGLTSNPIWGIDEISTIADPSPESILGVGELNCNGNTDGACNTNNLFVTYTASATSYAAIACTQSTNSSLMDWYLPSICQMGYDTEGAGSGCGTALSPNQSNIQSNLIDQGVTAGLSMTTYWSSTELADSPVSYAWIEIFADPGTSSAQGYLFKNAIENVRCVRALTP